MQAHQPADAVGDHDGWTTHDLVQKLQRLLPPILKIVDRVGGCGSWVWFVRVSIAEEVDGKHAAVLAEDGQVLPPVVTAMSMMWVG